MSEIISVVLPTYNEKGNIVELINEIIKNIKLLGMNYEILVVDDNSPDGTASFVMQEFNNDINVKTIVRSNEKGLASAIKKGITESTGTIVIVMDTDFNHDPKLIPQMIRFLDYYDLIIGSRFTMGGDMYSRFRYYCSFIYNLIIRVILHTQIQDNLSGFFSIKKDKLIQLDYSQIFWGYGDYFFRLLFYSERLKFNILAVPVIYKQRKYGQSKTSFARTLFKYTKEVICLRLKYLKEW